MEMKQYLAHIRRDASAEQTVRAHLLRVGNLMAAYAEGDRFISDCTADRSAA